MAQHGLCCLVLFVVFASSGLAAPVTPPRVLVLGPTSAGYEAQVAQGLGFAVDTVAATGPASWATMTATGGGPGGLGFGAYRAIFLCDANWVTGYQPASWAAAMANQAWVSVATGNVIIDGEDFSYHANAGQLGAKIFITNAVQFATANPNQTGLFIQLSCYYNYAPLLTPVPLLDLLSLPANQTGPAPNGPFQVHGGTFNNIHLTASHPALAGLTDANLSGYTSSSHEVFDTWPKDFIVLAIATDATPPTYTGGIPPESGVPYIMVRGTNVTVLGNSCVSFTNQSLTCINSNQTYLWSFCVTNHFSGEIQYLSIPDPPPGVTFSQDIIKLPVDLQPGQGTCMSLYVTNQSATNSSFCFTMGAHNTNLVQCCSFTNCLTFPPCCAYVTNETLRAVTTRPNCYTYTVSVENTTPNTIEYVFLIPDSSGCMSFSPDIITLPTPLLPNNSETFTTTVCLTHSTNCAAPYCFLMALMNSNLVQCCSTMHCLPTTNAVTVTNPPPGSFFFTPVNIALAVALDTNVAFTSVTYQANGQPVASSSVAPFSAIWSNAPAGQYALTADGLDTNGGVWISDPVALTVATEQPGTAPIIVTNPPFNSVFMAPANIPLGVMLTANNTFESVTYLANGQVVASNSVPPFSATWSNAPAGQYALTANGLDTNGVVWYSGLNSGPVTIYVLSTNEPPVAAPALTSLQCTSDTLNFCLPAAAGMTYYIETTTNLNSPAWTVVQTVVGNGSTVMVTNAMMGAPQRFYHVRIGH